MAVEVTYYRTPAWLVALLVLFAMGSAALFILHQRAYARLMVVEEERTELQRSMEALRRQKEAAKVAAELATAQTADRRARLAELTEAQKQNEDDVARILAEHQGSNEAAKAGFAKRTDRLADLMKEAPNQRKELDTEETRKFTKEHEYDDRRQQMRAQVEALQQSVENERKKARADQAQLDDRVAELEARVRQITSQLDSSNRRMRSDGAILASAAADGYVVVDRGHRQNLRKGTSFQVWTRRGGRLVVKGVIQVIEVEFDHSTCRVEAEYDPNDPLLPGDQLHNPVYDPDKILTFSIRGDFQRFSRDELARLITDAGCRVANELNTGTDYLVSGINAAKDLELASKLGMTILSEDQLLDFVRSRPRWRNQDTWDFVAGLVKSGARVALAGTFNAADKGLIADWIALKGGKDQGKVESGVSLLVAGDGAVADMEQARALGVPVVDQTVFSHLTKADLAAIKAEMKAKEQAAQAPAKK